MPPGLALQPEGQGIRSDRCLVERNSSDEPRQQAKTSISPSDVIEQQIESILSPTGEAFSSGEENLSPGDEAFPESPSDSISKRDAYPFPYMGFAAGSQAPAKLNVLVAEDNPLNSRLLKTRLMREGHDATVVVNGQVCVDVLKASPQAFDVILMDIQVLSPTYSPQFFSISPVFNLLSSMLMQRRCLSSMG